MSLHEESSGLLRTHVNWEDIENEVRLSLATEARFGENKNVENIGNMKGFMSRIALIEPDWTSESQNLPKKLIVKIASQLSFIELAKLMNFGNSSEKIEMDSEKLAKMEFVIRILHNRECDVYEMLQRQKFFQIPIPWILGSRKFSAENPLKAYIIFEPNAQKIENINSFENFELAEVEKIVKTIAEFSSLGEILPKDQLDFAGDSDLLAHIMAEFSEPKMQENCFAQIRGAFLGGSDDGNAQKYGEKVEKLIEIYRLLLSPKILANIGRAAEIVGHRTSLIHGDLWSSNFLCRKNPHPEMLAIIDWQTVAFGAPGQDLARLFMNVLSTENRRAHLEHLLGIYFQTIAENAENSGNLAPFTLEQLKKSYQLLFPTISILVLPGIIPFLEMASGIQEEQKMYVRKLAFEKICGLLDDVLKAHEENLKDFPQFFE
ncbi:unnamed protein product [Caenorhabditis angaria]|uniref:CHK kinase-like domain-containing protein n=1 Tax=Caenorhabditis angaria TaxID=860376 RepID=A0A9P1N3W7_9PELO|nr:unnamed protein product [Caenorhabditis angaria]